MSSRRKFSTEFKVEAAHRVIWSVSSFLDTLSVIFVMPRLRLGGTV